MSTIPRRVAACAALVSALLAAVPSAVSAKADSPAPSPSPAASDASAAAAIKALQPQYVRIQVSPKRSIYLEFRGNQIRMAFTPADLEAVKPVRALKAKAARPSRVASDAFPEIDLPVPAYQLPRGFAKAMTRFVHNYSRAALYSRDIEDTGQSWSYVDARVGLSRTDGKKAAWVYWISEYVEPKEAPVSAPVVKLPSLTSLKLQVTTKPGEQRKVGVAVTARSGETQLSDITYHGKSVLAHLSILDRNKQAVASDKGPLGKYGFG